MTNILPQTLDLPFFEHQLHQQEEPLQRLLLIDQLAAYYIFTNAQRARELLDELQFLLNHNDFPDYALNYNLYAAFVANQLYQYQEAEQNYQKATVLVEDRGDIRQRVEVYIDYAGTYMNLQRMDKAQELLGKAEKFLRSFPDEQLEARLICREGFLSLHYANYSQAIELLLEADKRISAQRQPLAIKDYYFLTLVHSGLGKIYERNDDRDKSVAAFLKVVEMCEAVGMRTRLSWHYLNVGNGYMALDDQRAAENYFRKAIETNDDASLHAKASAYANLGYCHYEKEDYEQSLKLFNRAEKLYKEISARDYDNFSIIEGWRGKVFAELGQQQEALGHFQKALTYAQMIEDPKQLATICKDLATFYADLEDFQSAYEYQCLHEKFLEQYIEQVNQRRQLELEVKYDAEKRQQEAELLRLQATRLQLKALRAQMNPHFLYNALNSIQNYITSHEANNAAKYLAKFAKLMRQGLEYSELEIISLEKEIEFLNDYLYINEKLRFEDKLSYEIVVDDDIEEDIMGVPTMIVQPYVENAIEHGLRTKKDGFIQVRFSLDDEDTVLCVIEDNGIGREKARTLQLQDLQFENYRSRGTSITEKRLELLHQTKDKGLFVKTIDLKNDQTHQPLGTRVEIKIPIVEIQIK